MDIFISYKTEDRELVNSIKEVIELETSASCWMDVEGIEHADYFVGVIMNAIDSCDKMLFMVSEKALRSKWIKRETFYAEKRGKEIIPLVIDEGGLRDWAEFLFADIQYVQYQKKAEFNKFIEELKKEYPPIEINSDPQEVDVLELLQKGWKYFIKKEYDIAGDFFLRAAQRGNADAQYRMGLCYFFNKGINQNYEEAVSWFLKAAKQKHSQAMLKLAICHSRGIGTTKNAYLAFKWFKKAAELGDDIAMFNVGKCYELGIGIKQEIGLAKQWYLKAANKDNENAIERIAFIEN